MKEINFRQYIKEGVNKITVDNIVYSHVDRGNVVFTKLFDYYIFAFVDNMVLTIVITKNSDIKTVFSLQYSYSNVIHDTIILLFKEINNIDIDIKIGSLKSIETEKIKQNIEKHGKTGRIFMEAKAVTVRGDDINLKKLKNVFNKISHFFQLPKIDDMWIFENEYSDGKTKRQILTKQGEIK